jgi:dihydropteroate synthase
VEQRATSWQCGTRVVSLESPIFVGILNVTPDSFSDGGRYVQIDEAVAHALEMVAAGATIIDVGGESTRPGATRVTAEEQVARTEPVIRSIREQSDVCISIDTTLETVANRAIIAGADIINDVAAGEEDNRMFKLVADTGVGYVLMHRRLPPELDQFSDKYDKQPCSSDIVHEVKIWLGARMEEAISSGIVKHSIALDPGLGFGKSVQQNWALMNHARAFVEMGQPVYVGSSRKSFIGATCGTQDIGLRDEASALSCVGMVKNGVQIFRVHNVSEHVRVIQSQS